MTSKKFMKTLFLLYSVTEAFSVRLPGNEKYLWCHSYVAHWLLDQKELTFYLSVLKVKTNSLMVGFNTPNKIYDLPLWIYYFSPTFGPLLCHDFNKQNKKVEKKEKVFQTPCSNYCFHAETSKRAANQTLNYSLHLFIW